ncbi:glycosyltransferase [Butyrivibrio sp. WCD3002]|uniref:glycosyltransferase n=1 Tax=Butyrivibrio sp. WCD3002 TaxID=1280676 RepID=UPI000422B474|nr:glycosyltransferase [Butyrivibrio sp. WCD3002]
MYRVLQVMDGLGRGGAQAFIMNNIEELYKHDIICDFLIRRDNSQYTEFVEKHLGKIILTPPFPKAFISNYFKTYQYIKEHGKEYDAIHVHANALIYVLPLRMAKKIGIPVRIIHSHNTKTNVKWLLPLHLFNQKRILRWANVFLACGLDAGKWMFKNENFEVIKNCIEERKFKYSQYNRDLVRKEYNIPDDCTLIGHVGAFKNQKNHRFIIRVFKEYLSKNANSKLLLLGTGILEEEIKELVRTEGISDKVIFAGAQGNIYRYYHAMDIFLFPSLFEGLPFSIIESQMSGLPALISTNITDEVVVTDIVKKENLNENIELWVNDICDLLKQSINREAYAAIVSDAGYGIKSTSGRLVEIYSQGKVHF